MLAKKERKSFKVPDTYIIVFVIMILIAILTYVIPAGTYVSYKDEVSGNTLVDPESFHFVDRTPVSFMGFLLSVSSGMAKGSSIIFFSFLICGFFRIIIDTGSIDRMIERMIFKFGEKSFLVIPIVAILMSLLGASGIGLTPIVAFIPIGMTLAKKLKLDPIFAVAIFYTSVYAGFGASPFSPYSVVLSQNIAGIPALSGFSYRAVLWVLFTIVTIWYIMHYANKLKNDINNSIMDEIEFQDANQIDEAAFGTISITRDIIIVLILFAGFVIYTYGALKLGWGTDYMNGIFMVVGIVCGFISGMNAEQIVKSFINGCKSIVYGALLIGFANAISIMMTDANIMHTIIYALSLPLTKVPSAVSAMLMYIVNLVFNFFIPSASGKAAIVMPLMAPFADVVGLTRQVSVLAYCLADGFGNTIIPTHAILISSIAIAKVPFDKWLKFQIPLFLIWTLMSFAVLVISVLIGFA